MNVQLLFGGASIATSTVVCNTGTLANPLFQVTIPYANLPPGNPDTVTVHFASADPAFTVNDSTAQQTVSKAATTTSVPSSSANPSSAGQSVTFTATVTATTGAATPTGTVTFKDGAATLGTVNLSGSAASFTTNQLTVGSHSITAVYNGDSNFLGSTSQPLSQTVNPGTTTTTVASSANPSSAGQSVTFTATVAVATGAGTPTGTVTFKDGGATLGTVNLSGSAASFTTNQLTVGSHSITAVYNGDSKFLGSTSQPLTQTVNPASKGTTTTTLVSSVNPISAGQSVTFTATVAVVTGSGTPTGTVTFNDGGSTLGTVNLGGGTASFTTSQLTVGIHSITAVYGGDANFSKST